MEFLLQPLTLVTFFPLLGVLVLLFMSSENKNLLRWTAMVFSLVTFGISLWVLSMFNAGNPHLQLVIEVDVKLLFEICPSPITSWKSSSRRLP